MKPMKIVLAGPPQSGKSCLREGLKKALTSKGVYPFVLTACPDGEGAWFQEAVANDATVAKACKQAYKAKFTPEFVARVSDNVRQNPLPYQIVDVGGIPSVENERICAHATHIVILSSDMGKVQQWRDFAKKVGLIVIAEIHSAYNDKADVIEGVGSDGVLRGSVHYLERGEPNESRPMIQALAERILDWNR